MCNFLILKGVASPDRQFPFLHRSRGPVCQLLALFPEQHGSCSESPSACPCLVVDTLLFLLEVSGFILRPLMHLELGFVSMRDKHLFFVFFVWMSSFSAPFVEDIISSLASILGLFIKKQMAVILWTSLCSFYSTR